MFPSYWIAIAPFQFSYQISLSSPLKKIFLDMIFVTERDWKWCKAYQIAINPIKKPNGNTCWLIIGSLVIKEICTCTNIMHTKSRFIYEGLSKMFMNDLSPYKHFNTLEGFEICNCILLINKSPFMLCIF